MTLTSDFQYATAILTLSGAIALVPVNLVLIYILIRHNPLKNPFSLLFINVSIGDCSYLVSTGVWHYTQTIFPESAGLCKPIALFLTILTAVTEFVGTYTTAIVALLRAYAIWQSTRSVRMANMTLKEAIVVLAAIWTVGIVGLSSMIIVTTCTPTANVSAEDGYFPMDGLPEDLHALSQVVLINGTILVCYTYICIVIYKKQQHVAAFNAHHASHKKTIYVLMAYMVFYTVFTMPLHLYMSFKLGWLSDSADQSKEQVIIYMLVSVLIPFAGCAFNPWFLYSISSFLKESLKDIEYLKFSRVWSIT